MPRWGPAATALVIGSAALLLPMAPAAAAPVATVSAPARAVLRAGGTVRLAATVSCPRGYRVYELYVKVSQPSGARAQAYRVPDVACDGRSHRVPVQAPTVAGRLRPGAATTEALFYVVSGGAPLGARDTTRATLVAAGGGSR